VISCTILPNGNLKVTAGNQTRAFIAEQERNQQGYWTILSDLFEPYFTNGSYEPFDAGDGNPFVGLTSAPCIAEAMTVEDDGSREIIGRCWWYPNYMIRDPLDELKRLGRTEFAAAD
jgi:hypothetical protein